jgi:hypothetical protein
MEVGVLVGVMGVLTVIAVYFWWLRNKNQQPQAR